MAALEEACRGHGSHAARSLRSASWHRSIVGKVLASYPTLQFRINLTRTTLLVDSVPTMSSIEQLAECLLAEMDQSPMPRRRKRQQ